VDGFHTSPFLLLILFKPSAAYSSPKVKMISAKTRKTDSNSSTFCGDSDRFGAGGAVSQGDRGLLPISLIVKFPFSPHTLGSVPETAPFSKHQIAIFRVC